MGSSDKHLYLQKLVEAAWEEVLSWIGKQVLNQRDVQPINTVLKTISPTELRVDSALLVESDGEKQVLIVEVQLRYHPTKMSTAHRYNALCSAQYQCPSSVVFVVLDNDVAVRFRNEAVRYHAPWSQIYVAGPADVPSTFPGFDTPKQRNTAFLRAAITGDIALLQQLLDELKLAYKNNAFDYETAKQYTIMLERFAPQTWWEQIMNTDTEFISTWEKIEQRGIEQGIEQGIERGIQILRQGIEELSTIRHVRLTQDSLERLRTTRDMHQLNQWMLQVGAADGGELTLS